MKRVTRLVNRLIYTHLLMAFLIWFMLMSVATIWIWSPLLRSSTLDFAILIADDVVALHELQGQEREQYIKLMAQRHGLRAFTHPPVIQDPSPWLPYLGVLEQSLKHTLGQEVHILAIQAPEADYAFRLAAHNGNLWLGFEHARIGTAPMLTIMTMFGLTSLVAILGALALARWLAHPLEALRNGAKRLAQGKDASIPMHNDVQELDELAASFNSLATDVRRLIEQRTTILAGIAHDLRTPLARMSLALQLEQEAPNPARLAKMEGYVEDMRGLIDDYVDFSAGSSQQTSELVDIKALLELMAQEHSAQFTLAMEPVCLLLNRRAFERIINNLLENASKHGQAPFALRAYITHSSLRVEIENAGDMRNEAQCARAFEPFTRLDKERDPSRPGSGLGLSIVREIASANDWQVGLLPRTNGGVIAWLNIPLP